MAELATAADEVREQRVHERECKTQRLPGIRSVDVSYLTVERDGHRATPIGLWCVADGRWSPKLNDEIKRLAVGIDSGELKSGDGIGHIWLSLHEGARECRPKTIWLTLPDSVLSRGLRGRLRG
jgi:hypothetical protein